MSAVRCEDCGSDLPRQLPDGRHHPGELFARIDWPPQLDVERCGRCRAVQSYRWPIGDGVFERRRIVRG